MGVEHFSQEQVIVLEHVRVQYGKRLILQDVNMLMKQGEFMVVLGPNGAGKSTLLRLLLGFIKPALGEVRVFGQPPHRGNRQIGYAPQQRTLEADLTLRARDLVGFGLDGHRWGPGWPSHKRTNLIDEALAEVDASHFADAPVGQLSGGERQRLWIAQALLSSPRLLLLDEPLASLDLGHQQEIAALVSRICRTRGVAVLLVTHDINPLLPVTDRVLYIANGHCAAGTPSEVMSGPVLTQLYGSPVEVVRALDRLFVVSA